MKLPDLHVYSRSGGVAVESVILRDEDGTECDLTPWRVQKVERTINMGEPSLCAVTFFARLVEHDTSA